MKLFSLLLSIIFTVFALLKPANGTENGIYTTNMLDDKRFFKNAPIEETYLFSKDKVALGIKYQPRSDSFQHTIGNQAKKALETLETRKAQLQIQYKQFRALVRNREKSIELPWNQQNKPYKFFHEKIFAIALTEISNMDPDLKEHIIPAKERLLQFYEHLESYFNAIIKASFQNRLHVFQAKKRHHHGFLKHAYKISSSSQLNVYLYKIKLEDQLEFLKWPLEDGSKEISILNQLQALFKGFSEFQNAYAIHLFYILFQHQSDAHRQSKKPKQCIGLTCGLFKPTKKPKLQS